jgi:hypothetical protein
MLFDLRGRGRRRTVQILYLGLAGLMGIGLVGFGIGGGFGGGGLFSSVGEGEGKGSSSHSGQIAHFEKLTRANPSSISAWEQLTAEQLHQAGGSAYVENGRLTSSGKELFAATAHSWERYLALNPPKPSVPLAKEMLYVYGEEGLNQPASAVQALQIIVSAEPKSVAAYRNLAEFAYKAKNASLGDLASKQAISLAPAEEKARLKNELEAVKKSPSGEQTLTGTTNGKTFTVNKTPTGGYTGKIPTSTPAPATSTTTTKK